MKSKEAKPASSRRITRARPGPGCPIVGIGASAGGLEACTQLLKRLPVDTGLAFVLVQHLDPQHESALTQLLTRATAMPVREVTNNLRVEANHVYIIPPNASLGIERGVLKLRPRTRDRMPPRSIDFFFEALALDQRERAIGVILSGAATDGTLGLEAIKAEGGLTFAQDGSARYDSMPRSAAAAGCVDFVLSPAGIARELARVAKHPYVASRVPAWPARLNGRNGSDAPDGGTPRLAGGPGGAENNGWGRAGRAPMAGAGVEPLIEAEEAGYRKIILLLRNHSQVDFSHYKPATVRRRIMRRAVLHGRNSIADYAALLPRNPRELDALCADVLIGVTSFFRNAGAFDALRSQIFPRLLERRGDEPVRVWVLGCSTGQEAYSIAMAYLEAAGKVIRARPLQIFATDLSETNLNKARQGFYARNLIHDVSPERLRRFFVEQDGGYRVIKSLRELVVFARQNVVSDPPFSRMDLISCRNVMIYLEPSLQKKVLPSFHYALNPGGFLFLGASESIGGFTDLFQPVDRKQKIFSRIAAPPQVVQLPVPGARAERFLSGLPRLAARTPGKKRGSALDIFRGELNAEREADRVTVNQFAPPGVLISDNLQVLQFRGPTGAYLEPPTGKASFDLLKMAREGLMLPLRATIKRARQENKTVRLEGVPLLQNGGTRLVNVEVVPLKNLKDRCFLVLFEDAKLPGLAAAETTPPMPDARGALKAARIAQRTEDSRRMAALERELAEARDYLQSVQEHQESANEELQAANEESQSANEELQSLNEELETSKEELESTNEELTTVNEEMVNRNSELNRLNNDLTNFQASTKLVVVLLGRDLTIRRFSAQAERQFHLHASDLGRAIGDIRHNLDLPDLEALITEVITSLRECEREVRSLDGNWFSLRVRPYLTADNKVDGAVFVLLDINASKQAEQQVTDARDFAEAIIGSVRDPLLILDADLRVQMANEAFLTSFKVSHAKLADRRLGELNRGQWKVPQLRKLLRAVLSGNSTFSDFELTLNLEGIGRRTFLLNGRKLGQDSGHREKILLGLQDITTVLAVQNDLRRSEKRYRRLFETAQDGILILDPGTRKIVEANPFIARFLGYKPEQLSGKELWEIGLLKDEVASRRAFRELKDKGFIRYDDLPLKTRAGQRRDVEFVSNLYRENGHDVIQCNIRDITERKQAQIEMRQSEERYRTLFDSMDEGYCIIEMIFNRRQKPVDWRYLAVNPSFAKQTGLRNALGNRVSELVPKLEPHWLETYGKVALTGQPVRFVGEAEGLGRRWFDLYAFRVGGPGSRNVAVLFTNITSRKQTEEALRTAQIQLASHAARLEKMVVTRTTELTATNRRLEASLASTRRGQQENLTLLAESQVMQEKLRNLTHQIITTQEEERKQISRELHDEVVQTLVGINVELSAVNSGATPCSPKVKRKIAYIRQLVTNSVSAVHRFARGLRPAVLDDLGLIPALHAHCKSLAAQRKIKIKINAFGGVEALGATERTVLFRVAQEALTNVVRHAQATRIDVGIRAIPDAIRMEIADNGKSFSVKKILLAKNNKRLGVVGMRERVEMVGGRLTIESAPGKGTIVRADVPFPPQAEIKMTIAKKITVMLAEDHAIVRQGLCAWLNADGQFVIVGEARDGREAVPMARKLRPDIILMDIAMPLLNGLEATRQILAANPAARVLVLSAHSDDEYVDGARTAGAAGFLQKQTSANVLTKAIREIVKGGTFFSPAIARRLAYRQSHARARPGMVRARNIQLTPRESEVLQLVTTGSANKRVASKLGISIKAVEKHLQHLMDKLNLHDLAALTRYALAGGGLGHAVQLTIV